MAAVSWETKIASGILGPAASFAFAAFEKQQGIGDSYKIDQISNYVRELQWNISALCQSGKKLSGSLLDTLVALKQDHFTDLVAFINSDYFQIANVVALLAEHTSAKNEKMAEQCQEELIDLLKQATKDLPSRLETLHNALTRTDEDALMELAARKMNPVGVSGDMITYWLKMRAFFLPYWLAQAQAIGILTTTPERLDPRLVSQGPLAIVTKNPKPSELTWELYPDFDTTPEKLELNGWHCFEIQVRLDTAGFEGKLHSSSWTRETAGMAFLQEPKLIRCLRQEQPGFGPMDDVSFEHTDRTFRLIYNRVNQSFRLQAMFLSGTPYLYMDDQEEVKNRSGSRGQGEYFNPYDSGTFHVWTGKWEKQDERGWR